jgi:hypothetical protein
MFWIRHPQPLLSTRAVAMQVVARKATALRDLHVIIVDQAASAPIIDDDGAPQPPASPIPGRARP